MFIFAIVNIIQGYSVYIYIYIYPELASLGLGSQQNDHSFSRDSKSRSDTSASDASTKRYWSAPTSYPSYPASSSRRPSYTPPGRSQSPPDLSASFVPAAQYSGQSALSDLDLDEVDEPDYTHPSRMNMERVDLDVQHLDEALLAQLTEMMEEVDLATRGIPITSHSPSYTTSFDLPHAHHHHASYVADIEAMNQLENELQHLYTAELDALSILSCTKPGTGHGHSWSSQKPLSYVPRDRDLAFMTRLSDDTSDSSLEL